MGHLSITFRRCGGIFLLAALLLVLALPAQVHAGKARVAAAANFTSAAREIGARFESSTGHRVSFSFASTGQLYAQIAQGAPFDVFLAADRERPARAVEQGFAVPGSRFTYAAGKLVLFSTRAALVRGPETLKAGRFKRLAIANPVTAPYGAAAVEVMQALGVHEALRPKIVRGNSIAQTYQFVETGNAELGFVALSQVIRHDAGSRWLVPDDLYTPIYQDAVLLKPGADNEAARAFLAFLRGQEARAVKQLYGYGSGE